MDWQNLIPGSYVGDSEIAWVKKILDEIKASGVTLTEAQNEAAAISILTAINEIVEYYY